MPSVPLDFLGNLRRTHNCGELRASDAGKKALLMGWVHRRRDLGGVVFIHLRDREGVTQLVFHEDAESDVHKKAEMLASEYVIAAEGTLALRTAENINPALPTGEHGRTHPEWTGRRIQARINPMNEPRNSSLPRGRGGREGAHLGERERPREGKRSPVDAGPPTTRGSDSR
jgi:hypothetical protein